MPRIKGAPSRAEREFLTAIARAGGYMADCTHNQERTALTCIRRGWTVNADPYSAALTWAGWGQVPRMFDVDAAAAYQVSPATWTDYASRGLAPTPDGHAPNANGRVARFWWPWTIEAWIAEQGGPGPRVGGRQLGTEQCMWRAPGSTGRAGFCRATLDGDRTCKRGHTDRDRAA